MSSYSDELSLFLVTTTVQVPVAAKDKDDAARVVYENYSQIVSDLVPCLHDAVTFVDIQGFEEAVELPENSPLRNITPHGDEYGGQYTCEYYTQVEKEKRKKEQEGKMGKIRALIAGLDTESLELLRDYFLEE